jgi:hypothetical protein
MKLAYPRPPQDTYTAIQCKDFSLYCTRLYVHFLSSFCSECIQGWSSCKSRQGYVDGPCPPMGYPLAITYPLVWIGIFSSFAIPYIVSNVPDRSFEGLFSIVVGVVLLVYYYCSKSTLYSIIDTLR